MSCSACLGRRCACTQACVDQRQRYISERIDWYRATVPNDRSEPRIRTAGRAPKCRENE